MVLFTIAFILIIIAFILIMVIGSWAVIKLVQLKIEKNEILKKQILYNTPLHIDDIDVLDNIIQEEFNLYQIMNLAHQDNLYINPEMQANIITEVLRNVLDKISPDLYDKLSLYYKKDHIDDIIFNKIKLVIINYTIEINGNYKK